MRWIGWQEAVILGARGRIAWSIGETEFSFRGGLNRTTGRQSRITVSSIVAVKGYRGDNRSATPPLSNRELFLRDAFTCMYCGGEYPAHMLTRDHLLPLSRGGRDRWTNVVTACGCATTQRGRAPRTKPTCRCSPFPSSPIGRSIWFSPTGGSSPTR